eukprot:scaffold275515_cov24-Tisochrysis_lutea.AAC.1
MNDKKHDTRHDLTRKEVIPIPVCDVCAGGHPARQPDTAKERRQTKKTQDQDSRGGGRGTRSPA